MDIMNVNATYGIAVIDDFTSAIARIASKSNSGQFELASRFYQARISKAFDASVKGLTLSNGEKCDGFVSWAMDVYHMEKTNVYELCKVGENVRRVNYGTDENPDYYYHYKALYDAMCEWKWSIDEDTGISTHTLVSEGGYDARYTRDFAPSACQVLASVKPDKVTKMSGYDRVVQWIKEGLIKPEMSVRTLKQAIKDLSKPVKVEETTETTDTTETTETTERQSNLLFATIAIMKDTETIDRVTGTDNKNLSRESLVKLSRMLIDFIQKMEG